MFSLVEHEYFYNLGTRSLTSFDVLLWHYGAIRAAEGTLNTLNFKKKKTSFGGVNIHLMLKGEEALSFH